MTIAYRVHGVGHRIVDVEILDGISLEIGYGRVLALVGPNGAGKSTLLGVLAGDTAPTGGSVELDGRPLGDWSPAELARRRGVLLQQNAVAFSFTGRQVVEMGRAPWLGTPSADDDERAIEAALAETDATAFADRPFPTLSGGERARISLARVLAQETPVLLLDEPTAALDLGHQEDVLRIARRLAGRGRAVVAVLHDLSLAAAYADDLVMLDRGRLVADGSPAEVLSAERVEEVYRTPVRILPDPDTGRPVVLPRRTPAEADRTSSGDAQGTR
ncbi:MAG: hemin ABC transporter ATP-binding protein [Micrococcales bacterium 73-13]|nr:MAG: hemin ABC transporter ATP-binding protein [Micrococcales bacterium 73-13]